MTSQFSAEFMPSRFDHTEAAPRIYRFWEEAGCFDADPDPGREPYCIVIPPPNVTGALHLGHALNNTLQDILIRMKRMQGFNTLWMPGTDHAGIATQAVVEKRLWEEEGKTRHDLGREKLVERIWQWKDQYQTRILTQLKQMGCSCDWRRTRFTLDPVCVRAVRQTFFDLFREGLIYRGKRLVNWDTFLQTAVSDDEVFHETVSGHFWHFRYPVIDPAPGEPSYVTIATTRPETMLADTAVAVHPDPAGALDSAEAALLEKLAKAPAREKDAVQAEIENVRARRGSLLPYLVQLREMARRGRMVMLPLMDRPIPLVADEWAKPEMGGGCVKITPAHDANDYEVGLRQKLPMINILNPEGTLNENACAYKGLKMLEARARVVADMERLGFLAEVEDREIDLAHSDRSKTPIEPYLADQWFVGMETLAQSAMDAVSDGRVRIFPPRYARSYLDWLSEKRDWPVSRQLWWGHRIPVWLKTAPAGEPPAFLQAPFLEPLDPGRAAPGFADRITATLAAGPGEGEKTLFVCVAPGWQAMERELEAHGFSQIEDVLDTWFSSALWPHSTLGWPERTPELAHFYPTNVLITSRDIITLWVARMVLTGLNNMGEVPFRHVFIHPKILDRDGETMSKSKGNGVDPLDIIEKFGPDSLRFALAYLCTETQDVRMPVQFECPHCNALIDQTRQNRELPAVRCPKCGENFATQWARPEHRDLPRGLLVSERFELSRNFCTKLWNAARFVLINLDAYTPGVVPDGELTVEERWLLSRLATVSREVAQSQEDYHFAEAARALYDFAWDEFCSFYLEMVKGRLQDAATRPAAQRVLAHALDTLLRLLHPIIPYITEELWQLLNGAAPVRGLAAPSAAAASIMKAPWPAADEARRDAAIEARFAKYQQALGALRDVRSRQHIPPRNAVEFHVRCDPATRELLEPMAPYFQRMANAVPAAMGPSVAPPAVNAAISVAGMEIFVDLAGVIDVQAEIARNAKEEQKLLGQIKGRESKLSNQGFLAKAPGNVVAAEREALAKLEEQLATVRSSLAALGRK